MSVVVPCHDVARFLPVTLASVQLNAAEDIEWVLVDDGSRDATRHILDRFVPRSGTVRVLHHDTAHGLAGARNAGTTAAAGRAVMYLDADDWLAPGHVTRMADAFDELQVDFVRTDHVQVAGRKRTVKWAPEALRWQPLHAFTGIARDPHRTSMVDYPYAWSAIYDMSLRERGLLHVDPAIKTAEDRLMVWRLHLRARDFAVVDLPGYFYRRAVAGSLTSIGDERQLHFFDSFDAVHREIAGDPALADHMPKFVGAYLAIIAHHENTRDRLRPEVQRLLRRRAASTIAALPAEQVGAAIAGMDLYRARLLRRLA